MRLTSLRGLTQGDRDPCAGAGGRARTMAVGCPRVAVSAHPDAVAPTLRSGAVPDQPRRGTMKALVYHGPAHRSWETVADPKPIEPTDIVVRVDTTTICGTDLHILKGDVPAVEPGRVLGHEAVGTVVEVGSAVSTLSHDCLLYTSPS